MIAAEATTDIVVNGNPGAHCGLRIDFGDGASATALVSDSAPFPLRIAHVFPKTADPAVRVSGAPSGTAPACLGEVEAAIHVSPAGSKIEYITLSTSCPEGWSLKGGINPDKSFSCAPIADASAPTNLIHCIDGMRYFARNGYIGCMHPAVGIPTVAADPVVAKMKGKGKAGMAAKDGPGTEHAAKRSAASGAGMAKKPAASAGADAAGEKDAGATAHKVTRAAGSKASTGKAAKAQGTEGAKSGTAQSAAAKP